MSVLEKSEQLEELTSEVAGNSIVDVEMTEKVLEDIAESGNITTSVTENILNSVSYLMDGNQTSSSHDMKNKIVNRYENI